MDLSTITIDRNEARKAVVAYRRALQTEKHATLRREDEAILRGYREIAAGHPIISLPQALKAGGEDSRLLPKLAIARADETRVFVHRTPGGGLTFAGDFTPPPRSVVSVPTGTLSSFGATRWNNAGHRYRSSIEASAIVPTIPPALRPNADLSRYWILFEADWGPIPPKDPALLRALGGGLYAVLATWDLSELERAVLGMTRR